MLIVDILITLFIFIWVVKSFSDGEVWKGVLFAVCFAIMAGVLVFRFKKKR
ncbi:hypothetical protein [Rossellomorea sp. KS-H15a]|uniref:hypothetical protein n=1 Tax=Rossellomorea sp. KS-H15a TaxID=2963940 RepID=UPI0020C66E36|nr:hypothetical protein [Rossellomorea sp. KS-H15a]UTE75548.1 hypothetical protein M1J35_13090 [Rossellomorea sp. KS-H15a]